MCDPTGGWLIAGAILSGGLGIAQQVASYQAAQDQVAYQNAVNQQNFEYQKMLTSSQRSFEDLKESQQQFIMDQNRMLSESAYADEIGQLNLRWMQEEEAAAQAKKQAQAGRVAATGEIKSSGRIGLTVDNLIADVYRQQAAYDFATNRNLAYTGMQLQEQKRGAASQYASRLNSQQPYIKQRYLDPLKPLAVPKPSALPFVLGGLQSAVGAGMQFYSLSQQVPKTPGGTPPPPTPWPADSTPGSWSGGTGSPYSWSDSFRYQPGRSY